MNNKLKAFFLCMTAIVSVVAATYSRGERGLGLFLIIFLVLFFFEGSEQ